MRFVDDKGMKQVVSGLKAIYKSDTREAASTALEAFAVDWGHKYSGIVDSWRRN
jgi:transposase-like protein